LEVFRLKYENFLNNVSPNNWRSGGEFNYQLKNMYRNIQDFNQITEAEKNIDWGKNN